MNLVLVAHNLRSSHNVGSLLRTSDGLGVNKVYLTGYSPYPKLKNDNRIPHIAEKVDKQIAKTALGAEKMIDWEFSNDIAQVIDQLRIKGYKIYALEQSEKSIKLPDFKPSGKIAIIVGREVDGIETEVIDQCDGILEIPMKGEKESFNVAQAAAIALYHCTYSTDASQQPAK